MAAIVGGELSLGGYVFNNIVPIGPKGAGYFALAQYLTVDATPNKGNDFGMVVYRLDDGGVPTRVAETFVPEGEGFDFMCQTDRWKWIQVLGDSVESLSYLRGWTFDPVTETISRVDGPNPFSQLNWHRGFGGGLYDPDAGVGVTTVPVNDYTLEVVKYRWREGDAAPSIEQIAYYDDPNFTAASWATNENDFVRPHLVGDGIYEVSVNDGTNWRVLRFDVETLTFSVHLERDVSGPSSGNGYFVDYHAGVAIFEGNFAPADPDNSGRNDKRLTEIDLATGVEMPRTVNVNNADYMPPAISPNGGDHEWVGFLIAEWYWSNAAFDETGSVQVQYPDEIKRGPWFDLSGTDTVDVLDPSTHLAYLHPEVSPVDPAVIFPQAPQGHVRVETETRSWMAVNFEQYESLDDTANGGFQRYEGSFMVFVGWPKPLPLPVIGPGGRRSRFVFS